MPTLNEVWIGLVGVVPRPGSKTLGGGSSKGAYVNALSYASNEGEYREKVLAALARLELEAFAFEDVESISDRTSKYELDEKLQALVDEVATHKDVRFGAFHNFMKTQ